jgi:hypothetical protein
MPRHASHVRFSPPRPPRSRPPRPSSWTRTRLTAAMALAERAASRLTLPPSEGAEPGGAPWPLRIPDATTRERGQPRRRRQRRGGRARRGAARPAPLHPVLVRPWATPRSAIRASTTLSSAPTRRDSAASTTPTREPPRASAATYSARRSGSRSTAPSRRARRNTTCSRRCAGAWTTGFVRGRLEQGPWSALLGAPGLRLEGGAERVPVHVLHAPMLETAWASLRRLPRRGLPPPAGADRGRRRRVGHSKRVRAGGLSLRPQRHDG